MKTKKLLKRTSKFLRKHMKTLQTLIKNIIKTFYNYKKQMKKIVFLATMILITCSCGSTKVAVDRPAAGTQTTITVTTNNPITTNVDANASANLH